MYFWSFFVALNIIFEGKLIIMNEPVFSHCFALLSVYITNKGAIAKNDSENVSGRDPSLFCILIVSLIR